MSHYTILTLNQISAKGLHRFPAERYSVPLLVLILSKKPWVLFRLRLLG